jgi:dolichyl-phosphate-mannose-protein mannosyltransferase
MEKLRFELPTRWRPELIGLIVAAFATRIWTILYPNAVVFDEVYFKAFAAHYMDGKYYFDIHPPLGKLLLAGWAHIIGLHANEMLNGTVTGMRFLPAAAGILLIPLMWGILRRLGASRPFAFMGAFLVLMDNAILVESRFILMDSMLMLFGMSAVYLFLIAQTKEKGYRWTWLLFSAVAAGAAISVKWTGLNALAIIGLIWAWDQIHMRQSWFKRIGEAAVLIIIPALFYLSVFWIHFSLLPHSGDGDAFMSPQFQSTLIGNPYYNPTVHLSFLDKFVQLNVEMYRASETLTATHPYGSKWYSWPLELRPIYYWEGDTLSNGTQGNIYLLGNPIIWWGLWIAIIGGLSYAWASKRKLRPRTKMALAVASTAFLINYLPFIGITRVMFLYHYFFAFLYSIIFAVMLWNDLATDRKGNQLENESHRRYYIAVLLIVTAGFLYFAPLSFGLPLSPAALQARMWLHTWR